MMNKFTTFNIGVNDIEILDNEIVKTASESILPAGHVYDPDFLYMLVRAVSAGEYYGPNKNADYFSEAELVANYKSFLDAHMFKNHENKNIENAIGDVLDAIWNEKMKFVQLLIRCDRKIAPSVVRGFEKGFMTDVSMGCKIKHSVCSICGNVAKVTSEYCDHVKYQKHMVMPDGRRVYEINIGPKFHDISAVLNGADRTAKMTGLIIIGNKVAFVENNDQLEKAASFADSLSDTYNVENPFIVSFNPGSKVTSVSLNEDYELKFEKRSSYRSTPTEKDFQTEKIAEIKKEIKSKIIAVANGRYIDKKFNNMDELMELFKILHTDFMTNEKCIELAYKLKEIANKNRVPIEQAFASLIKVLNVAGIELSPIEFNNIIKHLVGEGSDNLDPEDNNLYGDVIELKHLNDSILDEYGEDENMPTMFNLCKHIYENRLPLSTKLNMGNNMKTISIIMKRIPTIKRPEVDVPELNSSVIDLIRPLLESRSFHREHLIPRIFKITNSNISPNYSNIRHFNRASILKEASDTNKINDAIGAYAYAAYQNNRTKIAMSDEFENCTYKIAEELGLNESIEKSASLLGKGYSKRKAALAGLPLVYGYSNLQKSKMQNGENVSSMNRYIAENPANAYIVQALLGPVAWKAGANQAKKLKEAVNILKHSEEDKLQYITKNANVSEIIVDNMEDVDLFKNADIDNELKAKYSSKQIENIKLATILYGMERQDMSEEILAKYALDISDIANYLHICEDCITIEIEKRAGFAGDTALTVLQDTLMLPSKASMIASVPLNLIDGLAMNAMAKKGMKRKAKETAEQVIETNLPK